MVVGWLLFQARDFQHITLASFPFIMYSQWNQEFIEQPKAGSGLVISMKHNMLDSCLCTDMVGVGVVAMEKRVGEEEQRVLLHHG